MDRQEQKRVLIAGGGVAALEAALALRRLAEDRVRIELLAPEPRFWYRPLAVAAPFELGDVLHFELGGLAREIGADLTPAGLVGIDAWRHVAHTSKNTQLEYDMLLIACGALPVPAIPGALTFRGPADIELIGRLLHELASGAASSVAFVIPWGAVYSLPAYELALLTSAHLDRLGVHGVEVRVVTPEEEPLQVFGPQASEAIRELFSGRGITLRTGAYPSEVVDGALRLIPDGVVEADRVVALARLKGAPLDGIPRPSTGSFPLTPTAACTVLPTSTRRATSRASPSSRVGSRRSRPTRLRRRSPPRRAPTSSRRRSVLFSVACSSQGDVRATCAESLRSNPRSSPS